MPIGVKPALGGFITGSVDVFASLPDPSIRPGQLWYVQDGSGGFLSILNVYKYPKGLYTPNVALDGWVLVPINVKVAEDSTTLVNIDNWTEFSGFSFDISIGDRLIYNGYDYRNLTGSIGTAPDTDQVNWGSYIDIAPRAVNPYKEGRISFDSVTGSHVADTSYQDVRVNVGRELHIEVFNDTASLILNGDPVSSSGLFVDTLISVIPASSLSIFSVLGFVGVATMDIPAGEKGIISTFGRINNVNTGSLLVGFLYLGPSGNYVQARPLFPEQRLIIGAVLKTGVTDGIISIDARTIPRRSGSQSYGFTSQGIGAGLFYKGGFYDWNALSTTRTQAALSVNYGTVSRAYAAHAGIVPNGPGVVDAGQVGLRVTGIQDSELGIQVAAQTGIITDDITTLTADTMAETSEKFSGQITFELYVVSGAPTAYSLTFNYGYSKYEDISNQDFTITAVECVWQGNALDVGFDVALKHHKPDGWTYAATGFLPGNGDIIRKSIDQALAGNVVNNFDGSWKRVGLNVFIAGNTLSEGVLFEIITTANNTIQTMDIHLIGVVEEL